MHKGEILLYATDGNEGPVLGYEYLRGSFRAGLSGFNLKGFNSEEQLKHYVDCLRSKQLEHETESGSPPKIKTEIPAHLRNDPDVRKLTKQEMAQVMAALKGK